MYMCEFYHRIAALGNGDELELHVAAVDIFFFYHIRDLFCGARPLHSDVTLQFFNS